MKQMWTSDTKWLLLLCTGIVCAKQTYKETLNNITQSQKKALSSLVKERGPHKKQLSSSKKRDVILSLADTLEKKELEHAKSIEQYIDTLAKERQAHELSVQKMGEKDRTIADLISSKDDLHKKAQQAEQEIERLKAQLSESVQQVAALQLQKSQYDQYVQELQAHNIRLEQQSLAYQREYEQKKEQQLAAQLKERKEKERVLADELDELQKELKAARLELQTLKLEKKIDRFQAHEIVSAQKSTGIKEDVS